MITCIITSYVFMFCFFFIYRLNMLDEVTHLKSKFNYSEKENYRLQRKLDEIYNKIDKVRES